MTPHGRGRYWEEFTVGEVLVTGRRTVDGGDVSRFAGLTGDFNPLHVDAEFARTMPFGERVAHGILTLAVSNGQQNLAGWFEGTTFALLGLDKVKFTMPVTCILLLLQGVAEFLRSLHAAMTGEWLRAPSLTPERMVADV